ncbi:MAG: sugar-binding transcriptional regulator [Rhodobacteraceae bacterium]|nr:sugar-binding transcriptional regulator [Paracoccaceae bacterium]
MPTPDVSAELKTRIAWLYHVEGMTQDEIARELGLNRARVLRILANARQDGTVQIRVTTKLSHCVALAQALQKRWNLKQAIVIPEPQDEAHINAIVGAELGAYLSQNVEADMTIGLGWGMTLSAGLAAIEPRAESGIRVVSLLGGLTKVSSVNPSEFAWRVADKLSAECFLMAAPVFAPSAEVREALMNHSGIEEILRRTKHLDMAIISVGDLTPHSIFREYGLLSREEIVSLEAAGAIGDILCRFVDAEGEVVDHPVNDRVLAVHPRDLRDTRQIVLASGGWQKLAAIRAALKGLRPTVLITNERVAERLADEPGPAPTEV